MPTPIRSLLVIAAVVAVVLGTLTLPKMRAKAPERPAAAASTAPGSEQPIRVRTVEVQPRTLSERLSTTGTLRPNERVEIVAEIAGKVSEIRFDEGTRVQEGQLLVKIDDTELLATRERSRYRLQLASQLEAQQRRLLVEGIISQEEYDRQLSEKNVLEAESQLNAVQLAKTEIRAPFSGVVGLRLVSVGAYLTPQTQVAVLQDVDPIKLDFSLPEQYAGEVRTGRVVDFRVKGRQEPFRGTVYAIDPNVDEQSRSLTVRARADNSAGTLVPGAFADVELVVRESRDTLAVPAIAVVPELAGKKVYVLEEGKVSVRQVTTGIRSDTEVEILSGLGAGDRVITSGLMQLRPGMAAEAE